MGTTMKVGALLRTSDYRGDHSLDIVVHVEVRDGETVEAFVSRVLAQANTRVDWIELRELSAGTPKEPGR